MDLANFLDPSAQRLGRRAGANLERRAAGRVQGVRIPDRSVRAIAPAQHPVPLRDHRRRAVARKACSSSIDELRLGPFVTLAGALPQDCVLEKLQRCDIFALAATVDDHGASDIFPTVILEAMASARPVVSTTLAGIPEAVVDKETGLLVPAGESGLFADALETLCRDARAAGPLRRRRPGPRRATFPSRNNGPSARRVFWKRERPPGHGDQNIPRAFRTRPESPT